MTGLLLLLASVPQGEPALTAPAISEAEAIGRAKAKAALLGVKVVGEPTALAVRRDHDQIWRVELPQPGFKPSAVTIELAATDGHLVGFSDKTFVATPAIPGWNPRLARVSARARTIAVARSLGLPSNWVVGKSSFDGTGKNRWPLQAMVTFEERPLGYRYLVDANVASVRLNPRTGALIGYGRSDALAVERAAIRFRPDQAASIARKWRTTERSDPRPRVVGAVRLGWALLDKDSHVARLVYDVPFLIETTWVDANNGRVVGGRRTRTVAP